MKPFTLSRPWKGLLFPKSWYLSHKYPMCECREHWKPNSWALPRIFVYLYHPSSLLRSSSASTNTVPRNHHAPSQYLHRSSIYLLSHMLDTSSTCYIRWKTNFSSRQSCFTKSYEFKIPLFWTDTLLPCSISHPAIHLFLGGTTRNHRWHSIPSWFPSY